MLSRAEDVEECREGVGGDTLPGATENERGGGVGDYDVSGGCPLPFCGFTDCDSGGGDPVGGELQEDSGVEAA